MAGCVSWARADEPLSPAYTCPPAAFPDVAMSLSMHQASAPVFLRVLANLRHVLELGEAHAVARGFEPALLLQARLTPDMLPLVRQVQIASDMATRGCARLAGIISIVTFSWLR